MNIFEIGILLLESFKAKATGIVSLAFCMFMDLFVENMEAALQTCFIIYFSFNTGTKSSFENHATFA